MSIIRRHPPQYTTPHGVSLSPPEPLTTISDTTSGSISCDFPVVKLGAASRMGNSASFQSWQNKFTGASALVRKIAKEPDQKLHDPKGSDSAVYR
jgi:hypothetical protein